MLLDVHRRLFITQGQERILRLQKKQNVTIIQKGYLNSGIKNLIGVSFRMSHFYIPIPYDEKDIVFGVSSFSIVSSFFNINSDMQMITL